MDACAVQTTLKRRRSDDDLVEKEAVAPDKMMRDNNDNMISRRSKQLSSERTNEDASDSVDDNCDSLTTEKTRNATSPMRIQSRDARHRARDGEVDHVTVMAGRTDAMSGNQLPRDMDDEEDSLTRLLKRRFPRRHQGDPSPSGRSAFREVCHQEKTTPPHDAAVTIAPQSRPLQPRLLNDHLHCMTSLRPHKIRKPFAGLSEIEGNGERDESSIDDKESSGIIGPAQQIIPPFNDPRARHLTLAHLAATDMYPAPVNALHMMSPYITRASLGHSQFDGRGEFSGRGKRVDDRHDKSVYNLKNLPFGSSYPLQSTPTKNNIFRNDAYRNVPANFPSPPYLPLPSLAYHAAPPPPPPVLQPTLLNMGMMTMPSENWCALCKTGFRMTSDLVYHMRTYHRRDHKTLTSGDRNGVEGGGGGGAGDIDGSGGVGGGGVAGKGDTKGNQNRSQNSRSGKSIEQKVLRCNVCRETFRERHHLTRHMTSHVR